MIYWVEKKKKQKQDFQSTIPTKTTIYSNLVIGYLE